MLTKKDFKAIAEIIKTEYTVFDGTGKDDYEGKYAISSIAYQFADYLATQNPRFDRQKFFDACGL